jgi:hypothetical protein
MRSRILTLSPAVLAAAWLLFTHTPIGEAEIKTVADPSTTQPPTAQAFVNWFYDELRDHGEINIPDFPWVVRAKHVRGDQLQIVKFLHRDASGKGYDLVGAAVTVDLRADNAHRLILVHWYEYERLWDDGKSTCWDTEKIIEAKVPATLPGRNRDSRLSFSTAEQHATAAQRKFLKEECFSQLTQKRLQQAFGRECDELARDEILDIPSRGLLIAFDYYGGKGNVLLLKKDSKVKHYSIARFNSNGSQVLSVEHLTERTLPEDFGDLWEAAQADLKARKSNATSIIPP